MSQDPSFSYVETDLTSINGPKEKLVDHLKSKYSLKDFGNHFIVKANALDRSALKDATVMLKTDQPIIVVTEGLIPYLSADERSCLAGNVRHLLSQFRGGA